MTAATLTLSDFLLARIAEDEAEANAMMSRYREGGDVASRRWRRVLAECEAKRRIVEMAEWASTPTAEMCYDNVIRTLAAIYADHPDYRDEWRP